MLDWLHPLSSMFQNSETYCPFNDCYPGARSVHPRHCKSHQSADGNPHRRPSTWASDDTFPEACSLAWACDILKGNTNRDEYYIYIYISSATVYLCRCALWHVNCSCPNRVCLPWRIFPTLECHMTRHHRATCICQSWGLRVQST